MRERPIHLEIHRLLDKIRARPYTVTGASLHEARAEASRSHTMSTYTCLLALAIMCVATAMPNKRGSCLSLCGAVNGVVCPSGYSCQSNGCGSQCFNTSFVQPLGCAPFVCEQRCPLGYTRDKDGCQSCQCDYSALQTVGK